MNKIMILVAAFGLGLTSCSDSDPSLDLSKDVQITSFSIDGVEGVIDHEKMTIRVTLPPGSDVTTVKPSVGTSDGATVTPYDGMVQNFTNPVVYTVVCGNLYNEYTVTVDVVNALITSFVVDGKYQGAVNNIARTVTVTIPHGTSLNSLSTFVEFTEGATLSPASGSVIDLSSPVIYTLSYLGYDFKYTVTASQREEAFAFVGVASDIAGLPMEERTACDWMMSEYNNCYYISFDGIKDGSVDLSDYDVIWWHYYEPNEWTYPVPATAADVTVVQAFRDYLNGGGGLYLSTFANEYVVNLGITEFSPANKWGDSRFPIANEHEAEWGISPGDRYDHPVFEGLELLTREAGNAETGWEEEHYQIMLLGVGVTRSNKACIWNIDAGETQQFFTDVYGWEAATGAIALASFDWDGAPLNRVGIAEFPRIENGRGPVICNGAASYEWWNCGHTNIPNTRKGHIERLTKNIIDHLRK